MSCRVMVQNSGGSLSWVWKSKLEQFDIRPQETRRQRSARCTTSGGLHESVPSRSAVPTCQQTCVTKSSHLSIQTFSFFRPPTQIIASSLFTFLPCWRFRCVGREGLFPLLKPSSRGPLLAATQDAMTTYKMGQLLLRSIHTYQSCHVTHRR